MMHLYITHLCRHSSLCLVRKETTRCAVFSHNGVKIKIRTEFVMDDDTVVAVCSECGDCNALP